jgi:hypothetical protein
VSSCEHTSARQRNVSGQLFCCTCGRHLFRDDIYNLIVSWVADPQKTGAQPSGTVDKDFIELLEDFETSIAREVGNGTR